ncbi:hypothetical protein DFP72DRAFT_131203 [Ephemerocybe angulata]|uniref:F-box domain-containing protein n=1 Tax=Ephemerocybe angulata TaxID=980116 RepID=A0A8H6HBW4_9AGAR|nr:hypothetical protein DFP72DRAFT_131203 [Tulosesus angulatus]
MSPVTSSLVHEKLPTELMLYIFAFAIAIPYRDGEVILDIHGTYGRHHSPLYLGHICRAWRSIAWTIPSLWSAIDINIPTPKGGPTGGDVDLLEQWLQRAQNTPLSLRFCMPQGPVPTNQTYERLVHSILSRSKQWIYLDFQFPRSGQRAPFAGISMDVAFPLLQTLIVRGEVVPKEWLHNTPRLSNLIIDYQNCESERWIPRVECALPNGSRLQYLKVHSIQPELFLDILRSSSSHLMFCDVAFYEHRRRLTPVGPPAINLPRLVKFVISQNKTFRLNELLGLIHCPTLSDLTLSDLRRIRTQGVPSTRLELDIRALCGRWGRNLTSLTVSSGKLDECVDIIPALEVLSSLRHLTLDDVVYPEVEDRGGWKEWKHLSKLLHTSTTFLPTLDTLRLVYGFKEYEPPAVSSYVGAIESFRTVDNFPLRDPLVPFKVILYDPCVRRLKF